MLPHNIKEKSLHYAINYPVRGEMLDVHQTLVETPLDNRVRLPRSPHRTPGCLSCAVRLVRII